MPNKTLADYAVEQKRAESLLMGVVDLSEPTTPAPQRISVAALRASGQIRNFREISPGVLKYMGENLQAKLKVRAKEGVYELWNMSQDRPAFVTKSMNMGDIDKVLRHNFGVSLVSDRVELEGAQKRQAQGEFQTGDQVEITSSHPDLAAFQGQRGKIVGYDLDEGLYEISFEDTSQAAGTFVKPEDIRKV